MTSTGKKIFLFFAILSGVVTACFGLETQHSNHLGWALLLTGTGLTALGCIYLGALFLRSNGGESQPRDPSLWLPILGALIISLVTPLEYLFLPPILPRSDHAQDIGLILCAGGLAFYLLSLHAAEPRAGLANRTPEAALSFSPLLRMVLRPISASLLLFALGLGIGYSSLIGLSITLLMVLPGLLYRFNTSGRRFIK